MKKSTGGWLCVVLTALLLFVYYHFEILHANECVYSPYGDGYKNYYTLAYYLKYDQGTHFSGMNYPYGEHVMFTDNQPAVAWCLKPLAVVFSAITNYVHLIVVFLIFLSLVLAALFVYLILFEAGVAALPAVGFAVCIALLSPQLQRMYTHYSLSYACFVPILLFLLIRFFKNGGNSKSTVLLTAFITFFAFIHVYYAAMAGMFLFLTVGFWCLFNLPKIREQKHLVVKLLIAAVTPVLVLKVFLLFTDSVADRPENPWGFVASGATWCDIFLHTYSYSWEIFRNLFPSASTEFHFEGTGYIGIIPMLGCVLALTVLPFFFLFRYKVLWSKHPFMYMLPAAVLVLLFAMAFPFAFYPATEKYYHYLPSVVKQFRAAGRFNWVFYYTISIFSALLFYKIYEKIKARQLVVGWVFLLSVLFVWFCEANMVSVRFALFLKQNYKLHQEQIEANELQQKFAMHHLAVDSFQAIFPIGFFLNGSEKIYVESSNTYAAMKTSLFTGLPIVCGQMSRTSESQTFSIARLLADDVFTKPILKSYKNDKHLLLVSTDDAFTPREKIILQRATHLFDIKDQHYYRLPLSAFNSTVDSVRRYVNSNSGKYYQHGDYQSNSPINNVFFKRFENEVRTYATFGAGAGYVQKGDLYLYLDTLLNAKPTTYELSAWVYADNRRAAFPVLFANQMDSAGNEIERYISEAKFMFNTFGKWVRVSIIFELKHPKNKIYAVSGGEYVSIDEFMIRPIDVDVITNADNDSLFLYNNFPISKE